MLAGSSRNRSSAANWHHPGRVGLRRVWLGRAASARKDDYESDRLPLQDFVEPAQRLLPWISSEAQLTYGVPSLRGTVIRRLQTVAGAPGRDKRLPFDDLGELRFQDCYRILRWGRRPAC